MSTVQLSCPHCTGVFQMDSSLAGQQVACPLCHAAVMTPSLPAGEDPSQELPPAISSSSQPLPLNCPHCSNMFQVLPEMAGLQVACPHCHQTVQLPELPSSPPPSSPPPSSPPPSSPADAALLPPGTDEFNTAAPSPDIGSRKVDAPAGKPVLPTSSAPSSASQRSQPRQSDLLPPGADRAPAPESPAGPAGTSAPQSPPVPPDSLNPPNADQPSRERPLSADRGSDRSAPATGDKPASQSEKPANDTRYYAYPPGFEPEAKSSDVPPAKSESKPVGEKSAHEKDRQPRQPAERQSLLPPSADEPRRTPAADDDTRRRPQTPASPRDEASLPPGVADEPAAMLPPSSPADATTLLPPGADANADSLLPPGAEQPAASSFGSAPVPSTAADELLPPGAESASSASPQQVALPRPLQPTDEATKKALDGSLLIPTEDGRTVALRPPAKTVEADGEERELRQRTPEERAARRLKKNLIIWTLGVIALLVTVIVLLKMGPV